MDFEDAAHDFLVKGRITAEALDRAIQRAIEKVDFLREVDRLRRELEQLTRQYVNAQEPTIGRFAKRPARPRRRDRAVQSLGKNEEIFFGSSETMAELMKQVERIAPLDVTVMLTGETGTGKTRLARQIHDISDRRDEPFIVINCGAISSNLIESELFGHARGAFYRRSTSTTTASSPPSAAAPCSSTKLTPCPSICKRSFCAWWTKRVFEPVGSNRSQPMEGRLIVASNRELNGEVKAGRFRADLHYRLNVVEFHLLPLRQRRN